MKLVKKILIVYERSIKREVLGFKFELSPYDLENKLLLVNNKNC